MTFPPDAESSQKGRKHLVEERATSELLKTLRELVRNEVEPLDPVVLQGITPILKAPAAQFALWRTDESPEAVAWHASHVLQAIIAYGGFTTDERHLAEAMFAAHSRYVGFGIGKRIEVLYARHGVTKDFCQDHRKAIFDRIVFRLRDVNGARGLTALEGGPVDRYLAQVLFGDIAVDVDAFMLTAVEAEHQLLVAHVLIRMTTDIPRGMGCMTTRTAVGRGLSALARSHAHLICRAGGLLTEPSVLALTSVRQTYLSDLFQLLLGSGPFNALGDVSFLHAWESEDRNVEGLWKSDSSWLEASIRGLWKIWLDGVDTMRDDPPQPLLAAMAARAYQDALVEYELVPATARGIAARAHRRLPTDVEAALMDLGVDSERLLDRVVQAHVSHDYQSVLSAYLVGIDNPYRSWNGRHPPWLYATVRRPSQC